MKWRAESWIYLAIAGLCLAFGVSAFQLEQWKARLLPVLLSIAVLLLALVGLFKENLAAARSDAPTSAGFDEFGRYLVSGAWVLGFVGVVYCVGFLAGIALYCFAYSKSYGSAWVAALTLAVFASLSVYVVFDVLLGVKLYNGLLL